jgi:hypothetical protein
MVKVPAWKDAWKEYFTSELNNNPATLKLKTLKIREELTY